jgi:signal transduction histidine kinase
VLVLALAAFVLVEALYEICVYQTGDISQTAMLTLTGVFAGWEAVLCIAALLTIVARCKGHTLWKNTLICRGGLWLIRLGKAVLAALPLVWKVGVLAVGYTLFTVLFFDRHGGVWLLGTALAALWCCLWAYQWKRVRTGTHEIVSGDADYQIDTNHMLPDLRAHAEELNNLGQSISRAVEERMKSERFKAELITNVSHDLKTPLTSIINYVDLLKKEDIENPKAAEYIEVLDRKSQRLKKLTEDLVEASKASTGNLPVCLDRVELRQLADQALAEYSERLEGQGLAVVRTFPEEEVWVRADGRHLWRVLDNLLSNCAKYALSGTRVYVEVRAYPDCGTLSVKNISREALNVPPEALLERFVRGDDARTTEGSGLGLSIAQSLTQLQGGTFGVEIDGDLFKATVRLPLAGTPE